MEIGLGIAQIGRFAGPDQLAAMATGAEERGYASLWALDRLLAPVVPRSAYPGNPAGLLPARMAVALDPLVTLAVAAGHTSTIRLGTNVLAAPWYPPALVARALASLDVLSRGRLDVGVGPGWSEDELDAVGASRVDVAARQDDLLRALDALWRPGATAVSYEGRDFRVPPCSFRPRPVQVPRPPILVETYTAAGLVSAGRRADGWTPAELDLPTMAAMWGTVRRAAAEAGRDPDRLALVVRANVHHSLVPLGTGRSTFHGSAAQIRGDVCAAFELGARQVILDLQAATREVDEYLDLADAIRS
jgi:probable F420-dependent oxidoreductase